MGYATTLIEQKKWGVLPKVAGSSLFIALCAQIAVPLWFTPVPVTLQTLAIALVAAYLGPKRGAWAVLLYLGESALGLPFLAGGAGGMAALVGVRAGYLVGFVLAAYLIGALLEKRPQAGIGYRFAAFVCGSGAISLCGVAWLAQLFGWNQALYLGLYPFILGDLVKAAFAASLTTKRAFYAAGR